MSGCDGVTQAGNVLLRSPTSVRRARRYTYEAEVHKDGEIAQHLRAHLAAGGRFPDWSEEDLCEAIPDASLRQQLVAELQPRDAAFINEPIPGFAPGPHAPCAYLRFSPAYEKAAARAGQAGWPVRVMPAGHFL